MQRTTSSKTRRRVALVAAAVLVASAGEPALASVTSKLTAILEAGTGGTVVSIEKVKGLVRVGDPAMPSAIKVPARTEMQLACRIVNGKMQCYQAAIDVCPPDVILSQDTSSYRCDLDCHGNTPDPSGQCECDIRYDTCVPFP